MIKNLLETRDELDTIIREICKKLEKVVTKVWFKTEDGTIITSWEWLLDEHTKNEKALKDFIKESGTKEIKETKYYVIKNKISQEYDPDKLRLIIPWDAEKYITTKEVVDKSVLDKAINKKIVSDNALKALVTKSISVSFVDKRKIKDREEKEFNI